LICQGDRNFTNDWWVSNLIPKKTKKFEFGNNFMIILLEIKNNPYTPI